MVVHEVVISKHIATDLHRAACRCGWFLFGYDLKAVTERANQHPDEWRAIEVAELEATKAEP